QRAAPGAELDQVDGGRLAHEVETLHEPDGNDLTEHLGYFGSGGEIANRAQGIAGHVVAVARMTEAQGHEAIQREGAFHFNEARELALERCRLFAHVRRERSSSHRPMASMGK